MSCGNCLCGVPVVESKADLPPIDASGLCTGAMRVIGETGEVWILVRDEDLDPLTNPLQREWVKLFPADSIEGFKWAGTFAPGGVGPFTAYMADEGADATMSSLPLQYPLIPNGAAASILRLSANVTVNTLANPFTITVFHGGVATTASITVNAGATGVFNETGLPLVLPATSQLIDIVLVGTGESEASALLSVALELLIPRL